MTFQCTSSARLPEKAQRYLGIEGAGVLLPCSVVYNSSKRPESLMLIFHVADPTSGLSDVYDGSIWNDFLTVNGVPFLTECHNYGILLNVDWLQPYKHTEHSVGVIYLVILNLPRSIRYKREIVIYMGIYLDHVSHHLQSTVIFYPL